MRVAGMHYGTALALGFAAFAPALPAAAAESGSQGLEEVVVTAQFREEKLQTTPIAISAFTAENIEARGLANVTDLDAFVPNAVIQPLGAGWGATTGSLHPRCRPGRQHPVLRTGRSHLRRRRVHGSPPGGDLRPARSRARRGAARPSGHAVWQERGWRHRTPDFEETAGRRHRQHQPQCRQLQSHRCACLRGRETDRGPPVRALLVLEQEGGRVLQGARLRVRQRCRQPRHRRRGRLRHSRHQARVRWSRRAPKGCVVDTAGDENVQSARAAFRLPDQRPGGVQPDRRRHRASGRRAPPTSTRSSTASLAVFNAGWNAAVAGPVFGTGIGYDSRFLTDDLYTNYSRFGDPLNNRSYPNINNLQHWGVSGALEWKLTDNMQLKSVTAYRTFWNKFGRDSDGSPLPVDGTYDDNRHRQFTEEIQLTGTASRLDWAAGAFYYDAHDCNRGYNYLYYPFINSQDSYDRQDTTNWAIFAQGTWHATDRLSLTLGGRYTDDKKDATIYRASSSTARRIIDNQFVPTSATNTDYTVSADYPVDRHSHDLRQVRDRLQGWRLQPAPLEPVADRALRTREAQDLRAGRKVGAAGSPGTPEWRDVLLEVHGPADFRAAVRLVGCQLVPDLQCRQGHDLGTRGRDPGRARG